MTKLYQFALPDETNAGVSYAKQRDQWEHTALALAGGFTTLGLHAGAWQDNKTGRIYREGVHVYQVACELATKTNLVQRLNSLFDDQETFFVAEIGTAEIIARTDDVLNVAAIYGRVMREEPDPISDKGARAYSEEPERRLAARGNPGASKRVDYAADMKAAVDTALREEASAEVYDAIQGATI